MLRSSWVKILAVAAATSAAGCFEYRERIRLNADFSGTVVIDYEVPLRTVDGARRSYVRSLPFGRADFAARFTHRGVRLAEYRETVRRKPAQPNASAFEAKLGRRFDTVGRVRATLSFDHVRQLSKVLPGKLELRRADGRTLYRRQLAVRDFAPGKEDEIGLRTVLGIADRQLGDAAYVFALEAPPNWIAPNTCADVVGGACVWRLPLAAALHGEAPTALEASLPAHPSVP